MSSIRHFWEGFPAAVLIALMLVASGDVDEQHSNDVAAEGDSLVANTGPSAAPHSSEADVIVYGSTPGGFCAAISAAREGASVILLEPTDHVSFGIYGQPDYTPSPPWWRWEPLAELKPQAGRAIDHIAFSYRNIDPIFQRMERDGVEIVAPIKFDPQFGLKSFYVMSPDQVLVEVVEAKSIPEGVWDD